MGYSIIPLRSKTKIKQLLPNEIEFLAKMEHVRWMAEKQGKGWRYGKTKDNNLKLHPCLIPCSELAEDEREKDRILVKRIPRILASAGYGIVQAKS